MSAQTDVLTTAHRHELERGSAIDPAVIVERGYRSLVRDRGELAAVDIHVRSNESFPGLFIPMFRSTGERISAQFKPAKPSRIKDRCVKYLSPRGQGNHLDVHPRNQDRINDITVPLWITEGVKKGDSLTSRGCCVVTLTGVFNWRSRFGTLGDWEDVPLRDRDIVLCFDADARTNMNVARAMVRLGRWCQSKRAKRVQYLIVPNEANGTISKGVDDYFAAGGTLAELLAVATMTEPNTETADDAFSDSRLADTIADEVMAGRFVWCRPLGWLGWTGQQWTCLTEETVLEAIRKYVVKQFSEVAHTGKKAAIQGWCSMLSSTRLRAVLTLSRGIVERTADAFDSDPDLLNTPDGVVELPTGRILPYDPDMLLTKITRGIYRKGFHHSDWNQALTALADDQTREWFQVRVGQAIAGHPTPDGVIPILQGSGENGKSALTTDGILPALGDYAAPVSAKLITATRDDHSTERADLRGQRFLIAEELTEDRALNMTAIKQITDVSTIKARYVFRDNLVFRASHSLFVTSNYILVVNETDHGTWRRLALVVFPFTYRKPTEPLRGLSDRRGDPNLKARLRKGGDGQHDAIVTWAVEGARRWYQDGYPPLPVHVEADTRAWRRQADRVLAFWDECLVAEPGVCVLTTDLCSAFNAWMKKNGHHEWSRELFHGRFKGHTETVRHHVEERRTRQPDSLSRPPTGPWPEVPKQPVVYLRVRFRTPGEFDDFSKEDAERAACADDPGPFPKKPVREEVPDSSAHPARTCCEGNALQLRCKLCSHSPTYWQRASGVPQ